MATQVARPFAKICRNISGTDLTPRSSMLPNAVRHTEVRQGPGTLPFVHVVELLKPYIANQQVEEGCRSPRTVKHVRKVAESFNTVVLPRILSAFPRSIMQDMLPSNQSLHSGENRYSIVQLNLIVFAAMNNLVQAEGVLNFELCFQYLRNPIQHLLHDAHNKALSTGLPNLVELLKPMAKTVFIGAINAGDHGVVEKIISLPQLGINVNDPLVLPGKGKLLPLQRSAQLRNYNLAKTLLDLGADVNAKCEDSFSGQSSALLLAVSDPDPLDEHLVTLLIQAGADLECSAMEHIVSKGNAELVKMLITRFIHRDASLWLDEHIPQLTCETQSEDVVLHLLNALNDAQVSFDPNTKRPDDTIWERPLAMIDCAAHAGRLSVVRYLRAMGAHYTNDTLVAALRSGSVELCQHLLADAVVVDCFSERFSTSPLGEIIRTENKDILTETEFQSLLDQGKDKSAMCSSLIAAAKIGNHSILGRVIDNGSMHRLSSGCVFAILAKAISSNHAAFANVLLESEFLEFGTEVSHRHDRDSLGRAKTPLRAAMKTRNNAMVHRLIEHGFDDSYRYNKLLDPSRDRLDVIMFAAEWGDLSMIKELCYQGYPLGKCFGAVIKHRHYDCLQYLLELGASLGDIDTDFAWKEAILQNDAGLLHHLLDYGIDPKNTVAFLTAVESFPGLLGILVDAVRKDVGMLRRPVNRLSFALPALASAIVRNKLRCVKTLLELGLRIDIHLIEGYIYPAETNWNYRNSRKYSMVFMDSGGHLKPHDSCPPGFEDKTRMEGLGFSASLLGLAILEDQDQDLAIVRLILEHIDASLNLEDLALSTSGMKLTALLTAILTKRLETVRLLLGYGANVNASATRGFTRTPLQKAAEDESYTIVEYLLVSGADVNAAPAIRGGGTALQLASISGHIGIVEMLIDHGADILAPGAKVHGRTAIEGAAEHGRFDMVQFLARRGAYESGHLDRAVSLAGANGYSAIVDLLVGLKVALESVPPPTQQGYTCQDCGRSFPRKFTLNRHRRIIHGDDQAIELFQCDVCQHKSNRKDAMERHKAIHTGADRTDCHECGARFSRADYLVEHLKTRKCAKGRLRES